MPALVFVTASLRFGLTALPTDRRFTMEDGRGCRRTGLAMLYALYAGSAFLVESATKQTALPLGRRGLGATALNGSLLEQVKGAPNEPGVRAQL